MISAPVASRWLKVAVAAWLLAVITCMALLWRYKSRPGAPAEAPARWPAGSTILHVSGVPTLVMFAHPECPCTKASLEELAVVMARTTGKVTATVLFVRPRGAGPGWEDTDIRRRADAISGLNVRADLGGVEADRFGAKTSGQVVFYDDTDTLRFAGGITGVRGHVGDNIGRQRLLTSIEEGAADAPNANVFGCELFGDTGR
jgi:hypothetical protein